MKKIIILLVLLIVSVEVNAQCGFRYDYIVWVKNNDTARKCHRDTPKVDLKTTKMIKPKSKFIDTSKKY
jgi:hypothetical protein